jgi:hypothetical protein
MSSVTSPTDKELVVAALPLLPRSGRQAAQLLGVSEATVRRWRSGDVERALRHETRAALLRLLARDAEPEEGGVVAVSYAELLGLRSFLGSAMAVVERALEGATPAAVATDPPSGRPSPVEVEEREWERLLREGIGGAPAGSASTPRGSATRSGKSRPLA